jgi:TPR repeat protein
VQPLLRSLEPDPAGIAAARAVCTREADQGDADALYHLSLFDLGLAGWDPDAAIPGIRSAAAAGIPEAQYWLAWQYEAGPLLDHDQRLALEWYQAAAAREHRLALQRLAEAYDTGAMGLPVDPRQAADFRARAERCARREQG